MNSILCVDPSANYCNLLSKIDNGAGVRWVLSHGAEEALTLLGGDESFSMMVVASQIDGKDNGIGLIRSARLLASRTKMPIIFVMSDRDLDVAHRAMQAGATDVVLRSNLSQIETLLSEALQPIPLPSQTGRVLLVEDEASQARYIGQLCVKIGFEVVHCSKVDDAIEALLRDDFQLAIVDVVLQDIQSGLSLVRHIRQMAPPRGLLPILVMSGFDDIARRIEAIRIGADDFIAKPCAEEEFVWRLQRIVQFHSSNDPDVPKLSSPDLMVWRQRGLSERESEICSVLLQGCSDKEIAGKLQISFWTVRTHIGRIFNKLGVLNRRELMARFLSG